MKKFLKKNMKGISKLFLCLLMIGSCINVSGIQEVSAATYTMNDLNFMYGVSSSYPVTYNDGTTNDSAPYIDGCKTILLTTTGRFLYCLQHSKDVSNNTSYTSDTAKDLIADAETDTSLSVNEKYVLLQRVLSLAPTSIDVEYSSSGSKIIKNAGNAYQWFAAQIIVWEIMVGERNADGTYKGVTRSGATSVWDALDWCDSTVKSTVKSYYDSYSSTIIAWGKVPSFAATSTSSAPTYELTDYDGENYYISLTDTNEILSNYTFSGDNLSFSTSENVLTVTADSLFTSTVTVSGTNSLESGKKNLICLDSGDDDLQITALAGSTSTASPSAYFKIKIAAGSLTIAKQDNKGNYIADTSFMISYNSDMSDPIGTYTTGSGGTVTIDAIDAGTIYIQETSVPEYLVLDSTIYSMTINAGETSTYTATNDWKQGYIKVTKYDAKTGQIVKQSGVEFEILSDDTVIETITTDETGVAISGLLDYGTYTIREKTNPENYVIVTTTESQSVSENGKTYSVSIYDEPVVGSITITKVDSETDDAQGEATLEGATYVLKAKENILNPATGNVLYSAGTTISVKTVGNSTWGDTGSKTTDSNGQITWLNLPMGTYIISETSASTGYNVSEKTYIVTLTSSDNTSSAIAESITVEEDVVKGYIKVTKIDSKTGEIVRKSGTEFEILSEDGSTIIETIITDDTGVAVSGELVYGTYLIREKTNPDNYTIATTTLTQTISEDSKVYSLTISNEPVVGTINLIKEDSETGDNAQGDATLTGATYVLKAYEDILDPASGEVLFEKGETISTKTVGFSTWGDTGEKSTDSNAEISWTNLPMGTYVISESEASVGYLVNSTTYVITLTQENNTENVTYQSVTVEEDVIKGKIQISKITSDGSTGVQQTLEGVEFTLKLYSEVQSVGWDEATTYDVLTTDANGRATSVDLPYGVYLVKETYTPENYYAGGDFFVTIDEDEEIEYRVVNNAPFKAWLKLVKTDEEGNSVTLSNATFKLKDSDGNYIQQKSGWVYIDSWTTDEDGIAYLSNMVETGTYYTEEITSPDGFLLADEVEVEIVSTNTSITFDEDNDPIITVNIVDEKPTGTIILNKSTELTEDIANKGIKFQLTANSNIIDSTDGSIIYVKGDIVTKDYEDGIYEIDENGMIQIDYLPLGLTGASYLLSEVETQDGYVLLEDAIEYNFTIEDNTTKVYEIEKSADNELTETYFSKTDVAGEEVEGAQMVLTDNTTDTIIDEWTSTTEEHLVKGLIYGHVYTLSETTAPDGYAVSTDITFTYSTEIEKVTLTDKQVTITKTDVDGNLISGATLQIVDKETGEVVDTWTTTTATYEITDTIKEIIAEDGVYAVAKSFIVQSGTTGSSETIITYSNGVYRVEVNTKGYSAETGESYAKTRVYYVDEEGNTLNYRASNLEVGKTYILQEIETPDGYVTASDIEFTVTEDENQAINMIDRQVFMTKEDVGGEEVEGATIQVIDEDGNIVDEWVSTTEAHAISGLVEGKTYTLHEEYAPDGYVIATDVEFTVTEEKVNQEVTLTDKQVFMTKEDVGGEEVEGATIQVIDEDGNIVDEWVSTSEAHTISGLVEGKTYTLHEEAAPNGYYVANDIEFTISNDKVNEYYTIVDEKILTDIQVIKIDAVTNQTIKNLDFMFTLYSDEECTQEITSGHADKDTGIATFAELEYGTYYIRETQAPKGYQLSNEVIEVIIDDDLENVGEVYSLEYVNTPIPTVTVTTGDDTPVEALWWMTFVVGISGVYLSCKKKKYLD